jgi:hypothetical protein
MKHVFSSESPGDTHYLKGVLERAGIACVIKNEQLIGGLGDIPFLECVPELWVLSDADAQRARALIEEHESRPAAASPWRCPRCGEGNEGQFALCWNCGEPDDRDRDR